MGAALIIAALVPAVRERASDGGIIGNDAVEADAATAAEQWRAGDRASGERRKPEAINRCRRAVAFCPTDRSCGRAWVSPSAKAAGAGSDRGTAISGSADPDLPITRIYLGGLLVRDGRPGKAATQ